MTVQELIDELMKVEDKTKIVEIHITTRSEYEYVTDIIDFGNSVVIS